MSQDPPRCPNCGNALSPAASFCGSCQRPADPLRQFRARARLTALAIVVAAAAAAGLWLRSARKEAAGQGPQSLPAPVQDPAYDQLLARSEAEAAGGRYRPAVALLLEARSLRPERPEAPERLESLRQKLMKDHQVAHDQPTPTTAAAPRVPAPEAAMVKLPAGSFIMGADGPGGEADEYPAHEVYLDAFSLESQEVTVARYRRFCAQTGRPFPRQPAWSTDQHPVVAVTWRDAQAFCRHQGSRLPTEAEWERAARAGLPRRFGFSDRPEALASYAWFAGDSEGHAHPVGTHPAMMTRFSDMYGNVWEWVADWYSATYYEASPKRNPQGPRSGEEKVLRGGAFDSPAAALAATFRDKFSPDHGEEDRGFRCARSLSR